ncbi:hypothetical protein LCGC14_2844130 [marine sediment metagenome]|uniref:Uncharacterized protein n=1 Tax=marine sediment metagenome TaxID=412755 RepID=A0A0F9AIW6_9ZZZZ
MTEDKQRLLAVDGVEQRLKEYINANASYISNLTQKGRDDVHQIYEQAVWIDSHLNNSCIVDPFFKFHFNEEEDAVAFKLRWS